MIFSISNDFLSLIKRYCRDKNEGQAPRSIDTCINTSFNAYLFSTVESSDNAMHYVEREARNRADFKSLLV